MTEVAASSSVPTNDSDATARIVGPDGLTNKERRKAKQAEKRKRADEGATSKVSVDAAGSPTSGEAGVNQDNPEEAPEEDEVEALSHKERRKRRKMEKKGLLPTSAAGKQGEGQDSQDRQEPLPERSRYAVWVGNLSFQTTTQRLQSWFQEKEIWGITRIHMPKGAKKFEYNKGFAYVDLPSEEAVEAAVALSEDHLEGRRLLIKSASDFRGRPALDPALAALASQNPEAKANRAADQVAAGASATGALNGGGKTGLTKTAQKILRSQKNPAGPTLFIGNLSFNSTQEGLHELFEASAQARDVWRKPTKEEKRADKKAKKAAAKPKKAADSSSDSDSSDSDDSDSEDDDEDEKASEAESSADQDGGEQASTDRVHPQRKTEQNSIRGAGIRKVRMGTFEDTGKCKGFAFVDFHSPAHATASLIDPRNYRLDGRELKIEYASAEAVRRGAPKGSGQGEGSSGGGRGKWPSPRESVDQRRSAPEWRVNKGKGPRARHSAEDGRKRNGDGVPSAQEETAASPNVEQTESDGKRHKETQAERQARREREAKEGKSKKRAKPGAALANAQRGKTGIDLSGEAGTKTTFD